MIRRLIDAMLHKVLGAPKEDEKLSEEEVSEARNKMTFTNEWLTDATDTEKTWFNSFHLMNPMGNREKNATNQEKWTIDRKRKYFFVDLGGQGFKGGEIPVFAALIMEDEVIYINYHVGGKRGVRGMKYWYEIDAIQVPDALRPKMTEATLRELVVEVLNQKSRNIHNKVQVETVDIQFQENCFSLAAVIDIEEVKKRNLEKATGFVNEYVINASLEEQAWFESFHFEMPLGNRPIELNEYTNWTIDRNKKIFLFKLGGQGFLDSEIPSFGVLIVGDEIIRITYREGAKGDNFVGINKWIDIGFVEVSESLRCKVTNEEIYQIILESFTHNFYGIDKKKNILSIDVNFK